MIESHKKDKILIKKVKSSVQISTKNLSEYGELCSQLKLLYTAITRPRNTLIIYDQKPQFRSYVQKFLKKLGVIDIINRQVFNTEMDKKQNNERTKDQGITFKTIISKTDSSSWRKQGFKMLKRNFYEQASKCFKKSGDQKLYQLYKARSSANRATKNIIQIETEKNMMKEESETLNLTTKEITAKKNNFRIKQKIAFSDYFEAGTLFSGLQMYKQAGQCFFSGKDFKSAAQNFIEAGMNEQIGQSYFFLREYRQAIKYFQKTENYLWVLECLNFQRDWFGALKALRQYRDKISKVQITKFLEKYTRLELEKLSNIFESGEISQSNTESKNQEFQPLVIEEQFQLQESDHSELEEQPQKYQIGYQKNIKTEEQMDELKQQNHLIDFESIREDQQTKQKELSFVIEQNQPTIQMIDLEDNQIQCQGIEQKVAQNRSYFLKNSVKDQQIILEQPSEVRMENNSILDDYEQPINSDSFMELNVLESQCSENPQLLKLIQLRSQNDSFSELNDYASQVSSIHNRSLTKNYFMIQEFQIIQRKNQVVENYIINRMSQIVQILEANIPDYFSFEGYMSLPNEYQGYHLTFDDFYSISQGTIYKILNTFERFEMYQLCPFICERSSISSKLQRYTVSITLSASIICQENMIFSSQLLNSDLARKDFKRKNIRFQNSFNQKIRKTLNQFFNYQKTHNKQTIRQKKYLETSLILQGFYQKVLQFVDFQEALSICYSYFQSQTYKKIVHRKYSLKQDQFVFKKLPQFTRNSEYLIFMAESTIWNKTQQLNKNGANILMNQCCIKQLSSEYQTVDTEIFKYFPYNQALWFFMKKSDRLQNFISKIKQVTGVIDQILNQRNGYEFSEIQIYDAVTFIIILLNSPELSFIYKQMDRFQVLTLYSTFKQLLTFMTTLNNSTKYALSIVKAIFSVYRMRIPTQNSKTLSIFGCSSIFIHRSSPIVSHLLEYNKKKQKYIKYRQEAIGFQKAIFFCEPELNIIISPFNLVTESLLFCMMKKINQAIFPYRNYIASVKDTKVFTFEDLMYLQEKYIVIEYLDFEKQKFQNLDKNVKLQAGRTIKHYWNNQNNNQEYFSNQEWDKFCMNFPICFSDLHYQLKKFMLYKWRESGYPCYNYKYPHSNQQNKPWKRFWQSLHKFAISKALQYKLVGRIDLYSENVLSLQNKIQRFKYICYLEESIVSLVIYLNAHKNNKNYFFDMKFPPYFLVHLNIMKKSLKDKNIKKTKQKPSAYQYQYDWSYSDSNYDKILNLLEECLYKIVQISNSQNKFLRKMSVKLFAFVSINLVEIIDFDQRPQQFRFLVEYASLKQQSDSGNLSFVIIQNTEEIEEYHKIKFINKSIKNLREEKKDDQQNHFKITLQTRIKISFDLQTNFNLCKSEKDFELKQRLENPIQVKDNQMCILECQNRWREVLYMTKIDDKKQQVLRACENLTSRLFQLYTIRDNSSSFDFHFLLELMIKVAQIRKQQINNAQKHRRQKQQEDSSLFGVTFQIQNLNRQLDVWENQKKNVSTRLKQNTKQNSIEMKWLRKTYQTKTSNMRKIFQKQAQLEKKNVQKKQRKFKK